ncbi:MAG: divalent cation tolerance protein CutA, partial [Pseudomonadota bacterium]
VLQALERVSELHPYDVPEWLELNAEASSAYGHWLQNTLQR